MDIIKDLKHNGLLAEFVYLKLESDKFRIDFKDYNNSHKVKKFIEGIDLNTGKSFIQEKNLEDITDIKPERMETMLSILDKYDIKEFSSDDGFFNSDFQGMLLQNKETGQYTIAFRATESKKDMLVDGFIALNANAQYEEAVDFVEKCMKKYNIKKEDLTLTGHSLGGILVQMVGSTLQIKGYSYNPLGSYDLVHPLFPKAFRALEEANIYTTPMSKFAKENITVISYQDTGVLNGDILSNLATNALGTKHLGKVIYIYGENLGLDAHSMSKSNTLLEKMDKENISTLEDIEKYNKEVIEQSNSNSHSQRVKDWQDMTPEQKATAIKNGYGLTLGSNTKGLNDLEDLSIALVEKFETNKQEKKTNIALAMSSIKEKDSIEEKVQLLQDFDLDSNFDNIYSRRLVQQYKDKVIENKGEEVASIDFLNMQVIPNDNPISNNMKEYQHYFSNSKESTPNDNNQSVQMMS